MAFLNKIKKMEGMWWVMGMKKGTREDAWGFGDLGISEFGNFGIWEFRNILSNLSFLSIQSILIILSSQNLPSLEGQGGGLFLHLLYSLQYLLILALGLKMYVQTYTSANKSAYDSWYENVIVAILLIQFVEEPSKP